MNKLNEYGRRDFFKTSALGALGTLTVPAFLGGCSNSAPKDEKIRDMVVPELRAKAVDGKDITANSLHVYIFIGTLVIMAALELFLRKTVTGKAMLAASQDMATLGLMGADSEKLIKITFAISGALGAAAGVFIGAIYVINTNMGSLAGLKGWSVAILGGVGNTTGSMIGGLILGVAESLTAGFISTGYKDAIGFIFMILVLLIKPTGLMGYRQEEKV